MIKSYLTLARWPNLLIIGLIFLLIKTQLIDPLSARSGVLSFIYLFDWLLLVTATILIAGAGNVVNDIFDQDIDFHNKPEKRIVGVHISEDKAWTFYYVLSSLGLALAIFLCWRIGNISSSIVFVLITGALYFYSYSYKRQFLIGNVIVAVLAAMVLYMPNYLEMIIRPTLWSTLPWAPLLAALAAFAFLTTLIRELIKDLEDLKGDQMLQCSTLPIVLGVPVTKAIVIALLALLMVAVVSIQTLWFRDENWLMFAYFGIAVQVPAAIVIYRIIMAKNSANYHAASTLTKGLMLGGILSMIAFNISLP